MGCGASYEIEAKSWRCVSRGLLFVPETGRFEAV